MLCVTNRHAHISMTTTRLWRGNLSMIGCLMTPRAVMENSVNTVDHAVFSGGTVTQCTANTVNTAVFAANVTRTVYTLFCAPTVNVGGGCRGVRGGGVSLKTPRYFCHGAQLYTVVHVVMSLISAAAISPYICLEVTRPIPGHLRHPAKD